MVKQDLDDALDEATQIIDKIKPHLKELLDKIDNAKNSEGYLRKGDLMTILRRMLADLSHADDIISDTLEKL